MNQMIEMLYALHAAMSYTAMKLQCMITDVTQTGLRFQPLSPTF